MEMTGDEIRGGHMLAIYAPWTVFGILAAIVLPIVAGLASTDARPTTRFFVDTVAALLALASVWTIAIRTVGRRGTRVAAGAVGILAYAFAMSAVRRPEVAMPDNGEREPLLEAALDERLAKAPLYPRAPANEVRTQGVVLRRERVLGRLHVAVDVTWTKEDGPLKRQYRGTVHYVAQQRAPEQTIADLELADYSIHPQSGWISNLIGLWEIDLMMTSHRHVLAAPIRQAINDVLVSCATSVGDPARPR